MEYNYEDKEKVDKLKDNPNYKKEQNKKWLMFVLCCLPIFIGSTLFLSFCSSSPNYSSVFKNEVVDFNSTAETYYSLNGTPDVLTGTITNVQNEEYVTLNSNNLVTIDLNAVRKSNYSYSKFMVNLVFESYESYGSCYSVTSYQSYSVSIDGNIRSTVTATQNKTYSTFEFKEITLSESMSKMTLNIKEWSSKTAISDCDTTSESKMFFKNIRLYVYGEK